MNTRFKIDQETDRGFRITPYLNLYAEIINQAIDDLRNGIVPKNKNPRKAARAVKDRLLARAWFLDKMPEARLKLDDCLSVLKMDKVYLLRYLESEKLL